VNLLAMRYLNLGYLKQ